MRVDPPKILGDTTSLREVLAFERVVVPNISSGVLKKLRVVPRNLRVVDGGGPCVENTVVGTEKRIKRTFKYAIFVKGNYSIRL